EVPAADALNGELDNQVGVFSEYRERSRGPIEVGAYPARQIVLASGRDTLVIRIVLVGNRFLALVVVGRGAAPDHPDVVRFFDSFEVTDAALLAAAAARAQDEREMREWPGLRREAWGARSVGK